MRSEKGEARTGSLSTHSSPLTPLHSPFQLDALAGGARAGVLHTTHGDMPTPLFMPVATQGSVKAVDPADLRAVGAKVVLGNTYHLSLRPGIELLESMGGLHAFMRWDGPILTDSGGFQGFSLEHLRKIDNEGILFKSHIDGSRHKFTPESTVLAQEKIGADIIMPLDMCVAADASREAVEQALERTSRWETRCRKAHSREDQLLFGIVQGGMFEDLRERSVEEIVSLDFPGYAIGGLSVGESKSEMYGMTELTAALLPVESPRYLMGVGSPEDLVESVARGIDMFDCVLPTRIARNGALFSKNGRINIYAAPHRARDESLEPGCDCYTCRTFSAAYLHHLFKAKELLGCRLATMHNLRFILRMMEEMREAIVDGTFEEYRQDFHARFTPPDQKVRREQRLKWLSAQGRPGT